MITNPQRRWQSPKPFTTSSAIASRFRQALLAQPLRLILDSFLGVLESEPKLGKTFEEMFRALFVLGKKQKGRGESLQKRWGLDSLGEVRKVLKMMREVSPVWMGLEEVVYFTYFLRI